LKCEELANRLRAVDPLVIDYFIGHNKHLEDIGKTCISWEILEQESAHLSRFFINNNWCRFLIHKLVTGCPDGRSLFNNQVTFVTFNYDVSLEIELYRGLNSLREFEGVAKEFLSNDRILHVYGKIREDTLSPPPSVDWNTFETTSAGIRAQTDPSKIWEYPKVLLDASYEASHGIQIIAPDKVICTPIIEKAKQMISEAASIYIMGYGFDRFNNGLLDLPNSLKSENNKNVMFTNYNDRGTVNKTISRIIFGSASSEFLSEGNRVMSIGNDASCEKSIRTVYDALAYDFDSPEERR